MGYGNIIGRFNTDFFAKAKVLAIGPTLFLDASSLSGTDGSTISTWADESGNSNNFTSSSGYRPRLKTTTNGINGKNVVRFNQDSYMITTSTLGDIIANNADTFWIVFNLKDVDTYGEFIYDNECALADTNMVWGLHFTTEVKAYTYYYSSGDKDAVNTISKNTPYILRSRHASGNIYQCVNNGSENSEACGNVAGVSGTLIMGKLPEQAVYSTIDIAEIIAFNTNLSTANKAIVDGYLRKKYLTY